MPKLILSVDNEIVDTVPIEKELVKIGRRSDNDIYLDNLSISGYHSQIKTVLNDCFLEDMGSTNGTFVNSKVIKKHALKDGDIIEIGNYRIKYVNHLAAKSANSEFEKTHIMPSKDTQAKNTSIQIRPASGKKGKLQILNGKNAGAEVKLNKSLTTVGKPNVAVVGITKRDYGYFIMRVDGNDKNKITINGEPLENKTRPLENHDLIDVADIKLEFFFE